MSELVTDAMVEAARYADQLHDPERMECLNHDGSCCPAGHHNVGDERAHRVRAALEAVAPLIAAKALRDAATDADGELLDLLVAEDDSQFAYGSVHGIGPGGSVEFMTDWLTARAERIERGEA